MASLYKKNGRIYMSWYDWLTGKTISRSTGLRYTKANLRITKRTKSEFEKELKQKYYEYKSRGLKKDTIDSALKRFLQINSNKHPATIGEYKRFFRKFMQKFNKHDLCTSITKSKCEEWLIELRDATYTKKGKEIPYSKNSLHGITKVLKKFLNFLFEYNYISVFKLNRDVVHKPEVKRLIVFSEEDLDTLLKGLEEKNSNFKTVIYMLLYTGLRPSDIYNIKVEDIDLDKHEFNYYSEKTDEYFQLPIHPDLYPILEKRVSEVGEGRIFQYETINNIGKAFRRYLKDIGLDNKSYTLRTFRKTFITLMHEGGADLATVAKLVGHKQVTTTEKYYNKLSIMKKKNELSKLKLTSKDE